MSRYKVLIVDDDQNFRYAMRKIVQWEKYGFTIAADAVNGRQALEILEQESIDLVMTDMSMPQMNGVELIKEAKKRFPHILFIALSAYDDFEFVKESLKCGAQDYILKYELEEEYTTGVVLEAKKKLEERKRTKEHRQFISNKENFFIEGFLKNLVKGEEYTCEQLKVCLEMLDIAAKPQLCVIIVESETDISEEVLEEIKQLKDGHFAACRVNQESLFFLYDFGSLCTSMKIHEEKEKLLTEMIAKFKLWGHSEITAGVSALCYKMDGIRNAYLQAESAVKNRMYLGRNQIYYYNDRDRRKQKAEVKVDYEMFKKVVIASDRHELLKTLEEFEQEVMKIRPSEDTLNKILEDIYISVCSLSLKTGSRQMMDAKELEIFRKETAMKNTLGEKGSILRKYLLSLMEELGGDGRTYSKDISKAVTYIKEHYKEDTNLADIAQHIGLSENYLSNLFKKETGENIIRYINKYRIERSKELILDTNLKVYEIGEMVGYRNTTYFSTMFKKITDMTIQEFKNRKK